MDKETKFLLNKKFKIIVDDCADVGRDEHWKHSSEVSNHTAREKIAERKGWFDCRKETLLVLIILNTTKRKLAHVEDAMRLYY